PPPLGGGEQVEALHRAVLDAARKVIELARPQAEIDVEQVLAQAPNPVQLAYLLASMLGLDVIKEQALLEAESPEVALALILDHLSHETRVLELRNQVASKAQQEMTKEQREYWLRQQMRAIQDELGESTPEKAEAGDLRRRLQESDLPDAVRKEAERGLNRLERPPPAAPGFPGTRPHPGPILGPPGEKSAEAGIDLAAATGGLDA